MNRNTSWLVVTAGLCISLATTLSAQADPDSVSAASPTYFLLNGEVGSGGACTSTTYKLDASCGNGVAAHAATSPTYKLLGGYHGSADLSAGGKPWLAGVTPVFTTLRGRAQVTLHGTELNLGTTPTVSVDGVSAALVGTPLRHQARVRLPVLPRPGFLPVTLRTSAGTTSIARGIGVLPMIYTDPAPASNKAFDLVLKGTRGDQVLWALGIAPNAGPIPIGGFHHGLEINPVFLIVMPGVTILSASGELRLPVPATAVPTTIYAQALFASSNPGYAPGSFSNMLVATQ